MTQSTAIVVGAGAFGGWTALHLLRKSVSVTLVDAWGPGHSRASSGGESRVIRATYGADEIYTRWVVRSLELWKEYEKRWDVKLYHRMGGLWMAGADDASERAAIKVLKKVGVSFEELSVSEAARRFPQINFEDVEWAIYERDVGYLLARRGCQAVLEAFIELGGSYVQSAARRGPGGVVLSDGETLSADNYVFACGPWLGGLFPELGETFITPTRQEIYYFGTPLGDARYLEGACPIWIDNGARLYYGIPGSDWRGFKVADDSTGETVDPTTMERLPREESIAAARDYVEFRFPGMKGAPLVEARVCQYGNSTDHNFIIDRHPDAENVWVVGGGSGHGYKHGPALGEHVAEAVLGQAPLIPFFGLARLA